MGLGRRRRFRRVGEKEERWVWGGGGIGDLVEVVLCLFEVPLASSVMFFFLKDECVSILLAKLKDNK